jgi:hypothetical protein
MLCAGVDRKNGGRVFIQFIVDKKNPGHAPGVFTTGE